jgi:carboxylesterase type B
MPVVWVSINYRLNFFGFPAGKEAQEKGALNLGLLDMRLAMKWVCENIESFGGDPEKVQHWPIPFSSGYSLHGARS